MCTMPTDVLIRTILGLLAFQMPLIVIASVGLWFAVSRRQHLAAASAFAKWGFGLLIAYSLASVMLSILTLQLRIDSLTESGSVVGESLVRLNDMGLAAYPLFLAGVGLIARAVFLDRNVGESA
jgi:hypothetical protein